MTRRLALVSAALLLILTSDSTELLGEPASPSQPIEPPLWKEWQQAPDTHPNVPNVAYAGYQYGERSLPEPDVVVRAADHGAVGDGKADDTQAIRDALAAAAEAGGGAVLLGEGRFRITEPIFMRYDNVVLRGSGPERTEIYADASLEAGYGRNYSGSKSRWSWSGGMIWFAPPERREDAFTGADRYREGWLDTEPITNITHAAKRGDRVIRVADGGNLQAGDKVLLHLTDPGDHALFKAMAGDVPGADAYDWEQKAAGIVRRGRWQWPVEIEAVQGNRVTLGQPLRIRIETDWQPRLTTTGPLVTGAGVEHLTVRMKSTPLSKHLLNPGYNGIYFENAWDCWARHVTVIDADNGIGTTASKCITIDRFKIEGRKCHHATFCRGGSHDILWTRFEVTAACHHGMNVEGMASGNVWSAGRMAHGTLDSHRALPFAAVRTDLTIYNDGRHGGGSTAGPLFGARFVHWNIEVTKGAAHMVHSAEMMPRGAVVGVRGTKPEPNPYPDFSGPMHSVVQADGERPRPVDLHVAQLAHRLGRIPHHLGAEIDLSVHRADGESLALNWVEPFMHDRRYRVARRVDDGAWRDDYAVVDQPRFVDRQVEPGARYAYRVKPLLDEVDSAWSETETMRNRPPRLEGVGWDQTLEPRAVTLRWRPTPEQAGRIHVQRRPATLTDGDFVGEGEWRTLERLDVEATDYADRTVEPGRHYQYRLCVANASGESEPVMLNTFTRAAGTRKMVEQFTLDGSEALPAISKGKHSFGRWQWRGANGDRRPALAGEESTNPARHGSGVLGWDHTPIEARSFVWAEDFQADLSDLGAAIGFDYWVGTSGISTHVIGVCLQLDGEQWIVSAPAHTQPLTGWYTWRHRVADLAWHAFDAEDVTHGDPVDSPDLSNITAIGLHITRPINMRRIQFDNLTVWGK